MFKIPESQCPKCNLSHVGAVQENGLGRLPPKPGDLAVCIRCGQINQFGEVMVLECVPDARWRLLPLETRSMLKGMQRLVKSRN